MFTTAARDVMEVMRWKKPFQMEWKLTGAQTRTDSISTGAGAAFGFKTSLNPGVVALTPGWLRCHLRLPFTVDKERDRSRATGCLVQPWPRCRLHRLSWARGAKRSLLWSLSIQEASPVATSILWWRNDLDAVSQAADVEKAKTGGAGCSGSAVSC